MKERPRYFDEICRNAARRWDQLENDPELAGPWHQLFKQVQSPRHILSELLQNADDAGASEAAVRIEDHCFIFSHNGEDFSEEHFTSLCRFGYSNKRALHTIGFRGIGFKSTFSLGDTVRLLTPTLSVAFQSQRFTEPQWIDGFSSPLLHTEIQVPISDSHREREVEKNLEEWRKSPISLLFFKHIRSVQIGTHRMHWGSMGPGPVQSSEWMALHDKPDDTYLVVRSAEESFPTDALAEINQERLLGADQATDFPACKIEIVLGAKGRLYVVLPTGVETSLPFACNAPFIQDPARLKIKDPETSPTNRWLLERAGSLAASAMQKWLSDTGATIVERARAYQLFPDHDRASGALEEICATLVEENFDKTIKGQAILLTANGELRAAGQSLIFPDEMFDVWSAEQVASMFDSVNRPALSRLVHRSDRKKLVNRGVVERIGKEQVLATLQARHLPLPETWPRLLKLWSFVASDITGYSILSSRSKLRIHPAQGKDVLYSAAEVVRLGERRLLQSDADWEFLSKFLLVLNQNWTRYISEQRRNTGGVEDASLEPEALAAQAVLKVLGLEESSDVSKVIDQVAALFFRQETKTIMDCVQLAQIAAKLGAIAGAHFRFATADLRLNSRSHVVLFDRDGTLEPFLPKPWSTEHLLHPEYSKKFTSCSSDEWKRWIASGRSGLSECIPLAQKRVELYGRQRIEAELRKRGSSETPTFHYKTASFVISDWDFDNAFWNHWTEAAKNNEYIWSSILERVLVQPESFWSGASEARAMQVATTGNLRTIVDDPLLPAWVLKFRDLSCLPDTRGFLRKPTEMLRRTPETEPLLDIEFFVHGRLDREATRPLLDLLGVKDTPTGPDRILDRLRALALSNTAPILEVEKLYRRLDQMVDTCSTADLSNIKNAFREAKLILVEGGSWATSSAVYIESDDADAPGAAVIRVSVQDLTLWRKINVAERPTADLAIQWLEHLPKNSPLSQEDARRARALMSRHASRIWHECKHWLNLAREWVPVTTLEYALTMQTLTEYTHLHEWVKQKTADFQRLPSEITETKPFGDLPRLASRMDERPQRDTLFAGAPEKQPWLIQLGTELNRVELEILADEQRIHTLAKDLACTEWRTAASLEVTPYLDGVPAGTPKRADVVWIDRVLFVGPLPRAKLARLVPERLGRVFGSPDITAALNYCFGRSEDDVSEYMEMNFNLRPRSASVRSGAEEAKLEARPHPKLDMLPRSDGTNTSEIPANEAGSTATDLTVIGGPTNDDSAVEPEQVHGMLDSGVIEPAKGRIVPRTAKPSLIERFARSCGFEKESDDRFFHTNGSWIGRLFGETFPWERRTRDGELVQYYLPKDHCLEQLPLELEAEVWSLLEKFPEDYALILSTVQGEPFEMPGARLCAMREKGELILYPAKYRLVVDHDKNE